MTPIQLKDIRISYGLSFDGMAAVLRLTGKRRADMVREFESGRRVPSGPILLIYQLLGYDCGETMMLPNFVFEPVDG